MQQLKRAIKLPPVRSNAFREIPKLPPIRKHVGISTITNDEDDNVSTQGEYVLKHYLPTLPKIENLDNNQPPAEPIIFLPAPPPTERPKNRIAPRNTGKLFTRRSNKINPSQ